jgi:GH24 family phage-related lysozyme (muramidase)
MNLRSFFSFYKGLPHQNAAIEQLEEEILAHAPHLLDRAAEWYHTWSATVTPKPTPIPAHELAEVPDCAMKIIKEFEGCYLQAYNDGCGVPTIGWGTIRYPNGRAVAYGDHISQAEADQYLMGEVQYTFACLARSIPYWSEMNDNQRGALTSFAYNLGAGFYGADGFGTISRALKEKRWPDVPSAMYLYRDPGSAVEKGLARRRTEEGKLWLA